VLLEIFESLTSGDVDYNFRIVTNILGFDMADGYTELLEAIFMIVSSGKSVDLYRTWLLVSGRINNRVGDSFYFLQSLSGLRLVAQIANGGLT